MDEKDLRISSSFVSALTDAQLVSLFINSPPATVGTALIYYHKYRAYLYQSIKKGERDNEASKADEYVRMTGSIIVKESLNENSCI